MLKLEWTYSWFIVIRSNILAIQTNGRLQPCLSAWMQATQIRWRAHGRMANDGNGLLYTPMISVKTEHKKSDWLSM